MSSPVIEGAENPQIYDVLIIGAGPCGLAVAARLREETPSAMFTDEEQQRYQWIKKHKGKMSIKEKRTLATKTPTSDMASVHQLSMLVLDESGDKWMSRWDHLFATFSISHLRSPMFFHVDPRDRDGLLSYTHEQKREDELLEIGACVGQERSKHQRKKDRAGRRGFHEPVVDERDRKDYFTPPSALFGLHCADVARKYDLDGSVLQREKVTDIDFDFVDGSWEMERVFTVRTESGPMYARAVVLAVGAGNVPHIPKMPGVGRIEGACHAMHIRQFPDPVVKQRIDRGSTTQIIVVGGGLTAAHLAVNAIKVGVGVVHLVVRGGLKVKPFDVDLSWMGKFRNLQQAYFWSADTDEERFEMVTAARDGGSITPRIQKTLRKYCEEGRLVIHTNTSIKAKRYDGESRRWTIHVTPPVDLPSIDYIYYATGAATDFIKLPFLQTMLNKFPITSVGGLPCLTEDMTWSEEVPLFVTGKLAGLRIGPSAGNLAGARIGAERIAWAIQERLERSSRRDSGYEGTSDDLYRLGIGNKFSSLVEDDIRDGSDVDDEVLKGNKSGLGG